MALNLSKLFYRPTGVAFIDHLTPSDEHKKKLVKAKTEIQEYLRGAIPNWLENEFQEPPGIEPKFRTQGSWRYNTCNLPSQSPPQEMDWDLGIYLPVSLWDDVAVHPSVAAKGYYDMVEALMVRMATFRNWTVLRKPTCIRVHLEPDSMAHVDLPLYAAPNPEFALIKEAVAKAAMARDRVALEAAERLQSWDELTKISLACEDGTWSVSDPQRVVNWFDRMKKRHGSERLERISRYLKAWRDFRWTTGGPSSLLLMVCAVHTLNDLGDEALVGRDDKTLLAVLSRLSEQLKGAVKEPAINLDEDLNRLSAQERGHASSLAAAFYTDLRSALACDTHEKALAIGLVQQHLGPRFPNDPDGIPPDDSRRNIREIAPSIAAAPVIPPTKAG